MTTHKFLKCKRCGRTLLEESSQLVGYGPVCFKKIVQDKFIQLDLFQFEEGD